MPWRVEDEVLLQRLEDEVVIERLFRFLVGEQGQPSVASSMLPPRAAGLVAELRRTPSGARVVAATLADSDGVARLAQFVDGLALKECSPELLHHLAVFQAKIAAALELRRPESSATARVRSLAAWLALAEERAYLSHLEAAMLGNAARGSGAADVSERVVLEVIADIAVRAESSARDLGNPGRAALLALARAEEAARLAGASPVAARRARREAERRRNAVIEVALSVIGDALDEAHARGELASSGGALLLRAISAWTWTSNDEAVEHFVIDRLDKIGWELHRAHSWDALRQLLVPFRPMLDSLAGRIERDPSQIAYAAGCAQMFVFLAEVSPTASERSEMAERALRICPTHRNGRLVLASLLCARAMESMRAMLVFAQKREIELAEALLERAEALYPQTSELAEARRMLERVKKSRIAV